MTKTLPPPRRLINVSPHSDPPLEAKWGSEQACTGNDFDHWDGPKTGGPQSFSQVVSCVLVFPVLLILPLC